MMRLYFTRHGESEANTLRIISNRDLQHGLTKKGCLQAARLAEKLRGQSITCIYSSPVPRVRETAEILSAALGVPLECVDALREPDCGVLEGRGDEVAWEEHDFWKESWFQGRAQDEEPEGGETCEDVRRRLAEFIKDLISRFGETAAEYVLVTHGALILNGLLGNLAGVNHQFIREHGLGHTTLITTEFQDDKLICIAWDSM